MSLSQERLQIEQMTIPERLELIGHLWDSITDSEPIPPTPEWHKLELNRRRAAAEADPDAGLPWDEVKVRLLGSR